MPNPFDPATNIVKDPKMLPAMIYCGNGIWYNQGYLRLPDGSFRELGTAGQFQNASGTVFAEDQSTMLAKSLADSRVPCVKITDGVSRTNFVQVDFDRKITKIWVHTLGMARADWLEPAQLDVMAAASILGPGYPLGTWQAAAFQPLVAAGQDWRWDSATREFHSPTDPIPEFPK